MLTKIIKRTAVIALIVAMLTVTVGCVFGGGNSSGGVASKTEKPQSHSGIDYSEHSELLRYVMENQEYNAVINSGKLDTTKYSHPFAFLESKGYNVDAIKNGDIICKSFGFIPNDEPTHLYIATCVSDQNKTYYTEYMLRYNLSEKEIKDYKNLFFKLSNGFYDNAVFLNDAVSYIHLGQEEVLSCANIGIQGNENLNESMHNNPRYSKLTGADNNIAILADFSNSNNTFSCYVLPQMFKRHPASPHKAVVNAKISYINCKHSGPNRIYSTDDVFAIGNAGKYISFTGNYWIDSKSEVQTKEATFYSTDGATVTDKQFNGEYKY